MSQYVVLEQVAERDFHQVTDKPIDAVNGDKAISKYLTGKSHPDHPLVAIPERHFQPAEVVVEDREPKVTIKRAKKTKRARKPRVSQKS